MSNVIEVELFLGAIIIAKIIYVIFERVRNARNKKL